MHSVINPPPPFPLSASPVSPPPLPCPLLDIGFSGAPLKKFTEFSMNPHNSSLTPSYFLKVTKFLVKISKFNFLIMTEKHFCLCIFLSFNI